MSLKSRWVSRENILNCFVKWLKVANLPQVDWFSRITRKFWFWKNRWFFWKRNLSFWKQLSSANFMPTAIETVSQFDVECEWNNEISQNVQLFGFLQKKMGFPKNFWSFQKSLMVTILLYNAKELVRFPKTFNFWVLEVMKNTSVFGEKLNSFKMAKAAKFP